MKPGVVKFGSISSVIATALVAACSFTDLGARTASAQVLAPQERLCDPSFEDCRADILKYIQQETVEIDMGFWMMTDARYSNELVKAWNRGVKIRLLMDPRCGAAHAACNTQNDQLEAAGIPMRNRLTSGILHWKVAIFAGQGQVQFAGANYAPFEMSPEQPFVNYTDEIVYFTNMPSIVQSFMTKFDDLWTSTTEFADYANITGPLARSFPVSPTDPELNFPPDQSYRNRALAAYAAEQQKIDVLMFRITDEQHSNAMINAVNRGVPVRLITDETEYRNTARLWHSYNVDKMYSAGVQVRHDGHQGINHEKAILLQGSGTTIFGSSNWTSPSSDSQREHNMFTTRQWIYDWLEAQFQRKWTNGSGFSETKPFVPLPPDQPVNNEPANAAASVGTTGRSLSFYAGLWAHNYDIYFGTNPNPPLLEADKRLGPSQYATDYRYYALPALQPGTTYYWKIVSKTMANKTAEGPIWSFSTAGTAPPPNTPPSITLTAPVNGATFSTGATINLTATASDSDGTIAKVEFFAGTTLVGTDTTSPYAVSWNNVADGTYNLTARATDNGSATTTSAVATVTVGDSPPPPPPPPPAGLPAGWSNADVGATGAAGSASVNSNTFSVTGAGADVWGTADAFHYAYRTLDGDGTIVARVASIQNVNAWTKAGVMIRNSLSPSAAQAYMVVASSPAKGVPFQRRRSDGDVSVSTSGSQSTAPRWVKLVRSGSLISGFESPDGVTWTAVGSDTFTMGANVLVGLAVSSHVTGTNATAAFDNVTVTVTSPPPPSNVPPTASLTSPASGASFTAPATINIAASASDSDGTIAKVDFYAGSTLIGTDTSAPYAATWSSVAAGTYSLTAVATDDDGATTSSASVSITVSSPPPPPPPPPPASGLPSGWAKADIGAVPFAGNASFASGTYTVTGSGADVWGTADAFHFAYTSMTGDRTIIARVASIPANVNTWVKAGVMIRESLSANAAHGFMLVSAAKGVAFQRRPIAGGISVNSAGTMSAAPRWVKLQRSGNLFSAYESADGVTWTLVGTETIPMAATVYVGLGVTSHTTTASATCTFDNVSIQ
jgi:phosphatidylserine/phosphatidylglycerophosphate/cardiolipin synthase-like enzyme